MESLKPLIWEKGNDRNFQATWYGSIEGGTGKLLMFSVRPAANDKKTGYFLSCTLSNSLKFPIDPTMHESVEDARAAGEKAFIELVKVFYVQDLSATVDQLASAKVVKPKTTELALF